MTHRIPWILVAGLLVVIAANAVALGCPLLASSPSDVLRSEQQGALGEADGVVPDGTTAFDVQVPGVARLRPALLRALRQAATDAADVGVEFVVTSGWRSPEYEAQLHLEAVLKYGSEAAAARWVATPTTSAHVSGDAVDIGPFDAAAWLSRDGARYGLCQIYANEPWHYELRPDAVDQGCPPMYADASQRSPSLPAGDTPSPHRFGSQRPSLATATNPRR